jgi:ubiquinone/menaquinone biosynthesis C-methylase UbiE
LKLTTVTDNVIQFGFKKNLQKDIQMARDVTSKEFWESRLEGLTEDTINQSVFRIPKTLFEHMEQHHLSLIHAHIPKNCKVLDAGCGYGRMAAYFSPESYTGVDMSPHFLTLAKERFPNHTFESARLENLPFEDQNFEWTFLISIRDMIVREVGAEIWEKMLEELKRVARNILILEYTDGNDHNPDYFHYKYEVIKQ